MPFPQIQSKPVELFVELEPFVNQTVERLALLRLDQIVVGR